MDDEDEVIEIPVETFLAQTKELFKATPIRRLRLTGARAPFDLRRLISCPYLARLTELNLSGIAPYPVDFFSLQPPVALSFFKKEI
jgi:hypothetical protein